jgi:hypothetical protein
VLDSKLLEHSLISVRSSEHIEPCLAKLGAEVPCTTPDLYNRYLVVVVAVRICSNDIITSSLAFEVLTFGDFV